MATGTVYLPSKSRVCQFARIILDHDMKKVAKEPEIITRAGKPVSVILPIKDYQKLLNRLEDAEDVACLKKARSKPLAFRQLADYLADRK